MPLYFLYSCSAIDSLRCPFVTWSNMVLHYILSFDPLPSSLCSCSDIHWHLLFCHVLSMWSTMALHYILFFASLSNFWYVTIHFFPVLPSIHFLCRDIWHRLCLNWMKHTTTWIYEKFKQLYIYFLCSKFLIQGLLSYIYLQKTKY